jgi:hypothetical protein
VQALAAIVLESGAPRATNAVHVAGCVLPSSVPGDQKCEPKSSPSGRPRVTIVTFGTHMAASLTVRVRHSARAASKVTTAGTNGPGSLLMPKILSGLSLYRVVELGSGAA